MNRYDTNLLAQTSGAFVSACSPKGKNIFKIDKHTTIYILN